MKNLPEIDCVIIGVNSSATLLSCLTSIMKSDYPAHLLNLIYVDGGSTDNSIEIARSLKGVTAVALNGLHPTPGSGRNAGWRIGKAPFVQFLDSDTILNPDWLLSGVNKFTQDIGAVFGNRNELHPEKTWFNWIAEQEWNPQPGFTESFGGDVLIRREILETTQGYDEFMIGGEDPEFSRRIRNLGWKILHLDCPMTNHDIAMDKIAQYMKRAYRSGYGFANVIHKGQYSDNRFWHKEFMRILVRGGGSMVLFVTSLIAFISLQNSSWALPISLTFLLFSLILVFFPRLFRIGSFSKLKQLSILEARAYSYHCSIVVLPQFFGILRFYIGVQTGSPLQNCNHKLTTKRLKAEL